MTQANQRNVLIVSVSAQLFERFAPLLRRSEFDVDRVPGVDAALELTAVVPFDSVVFGYPLPEDFKLREVTRKIRDKESPCRSAAVLLLSESSHLEEAREFIGKGVNRVVPVNAPESDLQHEISLLLKTAPRVATRIMTHLSVDLDGPSASVICQTENLSESGMLVRTRRQFPVGVEVGFHFTLPDDGNRIDGRGRIVRHTQGGREGVTGIGIRFQDFSHDGLDKLKSYLRRLADRG